MRISFDMSSVMWKALLAGKDAEHGYEVPDPQKADKKVYVNSWRWGYENAVNHMVAALKQFDLAPIDMIMVFEGMHAKAPRQRIEPSYKEGDSRAPEAYQEFETLRAKMHEVWLALGATAIQQDYVEGDDILAFLAMESEQDLVIATGDRDLTVLNGQNKHGARVVVRYNQEPIGQNPYGAWDIRLIPVHKALVGDSGDKIKGVVGFGDTKWVDMLVAYGEEGLFQIQGLLETTGRLGDLHQQVDEDKLIKMICEQEAQCYRSYQLGRLHPEWCNTIINPLQITAGMVKEQPEYRDERLQQWYQRKVLITAENQVQWSQPILALVQEAPFVVFDIETSTSAESDEWVDRQSSSDEDDDRAVDVYGSELTGFSLTMGKNLQHTFYFSVDHADTKNISLDIAATAIELPSSLGKRLVIQNFSFEAAVCYRTFAERWIDNGYHGFLADMDDTKFMSSYVDENNPLGLKWRSQNVLGYTQQTYDDVTLIKKPAFLWVSPKFDELARRGRAVREYDAPDTVGQLVDGEMQYPLVTWQDRRYKMKELPATHVFNYGCDDTICTGALFIYNRLVMELEHTWQVYREVEIDSAYQHAVNFECGIKISVEKINELSALDDITYNDAWKIVRQYLIEQHFEGTEPPVFGFPLEPSDIKLAYQVCTGKKLDTMVRTMSKLVAFIRAIDTPEDTDFASLLSMVLKMENTEQRGEAIRGFNAYVKERFKGEPDSPISSPKKMNQILFETMKLPIRVRNKATAKMKQAGIFDGSPKTDALAIEYAIQMDATSEQKGVLEAMKLMQMVKTRRGLYYTKWPNFMHWTDGFVRPNHNQCSTNTRRASESRPNKQQLSKHVKVEGQAPRVREMIVAHRRDAVVVSMDFDSQELRVIANYSNDPNMVACYMGENLKDMHALTGLGIFNYKAKLRGVQPIDYETFVRIREAADKSDPLYQFVKDDRAKGKTTNFATEYGAMAPKVAQTLLVSEDDAQAFIDAREAAFAVAKAWKERTVQEAKDAGFVRSMLGGVRHLRPAFTSGDNWAASKAERQAVNFKVQSSSAEMTKRAEGAMWKDGLFFDFDAACYGPVHDEIVASVRIEDLPAFLPRMHACMVAPFAGMWVPIESSISFGPSFGQQVEIGLRPTREAIERGLAEMQEKYGRKENRTETTFAA